MRLVAKGEELIIKLEDKASGELFAKCPIDKYPGVALESVTDSSRYFVVRIQDDNGIYKFYSLILINVLCLIFSIMNFTTFTQYSLIVLQQHSLLTSFLCY